MRTTVPLLILTLAGISRPADEDALFQNLKMTYGITAIRGTTTKPDKLPENMALNAKVKASSVFEDQSADKAIDGDPRTGWASNKDAKKAWMMIQLEKKFRITHIGYKTRFGVFERVQSFRVDTGKGSLQLCYLDDKHATDFQYFDIDDVETDTIRWSVLDARYGSNTGAIEITVYGVPLN